MGRAPGTSLALLVLIAALTFICAALVALLTGSVAVLAIASVAVALVAASILSSWACYARGLLPFRDLLRGTGYALRKVPLYARFLVARQIDWVRSRRD